MAVSLFPRSRTGLHCGRSRRAAGEDDAAAARFLGRPLPPRPAPSGLKVERDRLAKVAQQGTQWAQLLPSNVQ